jgi:hypothetical protein
MAVVGAGLVPNARAQMPLARVARPALVRQAGHLALRNRLGGAMGFHGQHLEVIFFLPARRGGRRV